LGIKFKDEEDYVVSLAIVQARSALLLVSSDGKAKRTSLTEYPTQGRYGQGVIAIRLESSEAKIVGTCVVQGKDSVILYTGKGAAKTTRAKNAPLKGRATLGQKIIALRTNDTVTNAITPIAPLQFDNQS
jgi:DNA gyrase subunit A